MGGAARCRRRSGTGNPEFRDLKRFLQTKRAGLLLLRHIPAGESYWWTAG
jgi:hypothetical protein